MNAMKTMTTMMIGLRCWQKDDVNLEDNADRNDGMVVVVVVMIASNVHVMVMMMVI